MSLGSKIRELRIQKGLTQSELGGGLVTPSMISQIETDRANPSYKVLEAIAQKLETPLEYFLTDVQSHLEQGTAYKVALAQMASNSYSRAAELLTTLLEQRASSLNVFDIKIDLAICYAELSRHEEAISALEEVVDQSLTKQQHHTALRALNALANVEKRRRKYHHAIYFWRKGCELFDQLKVPDPFLQGEILNSLGSIHLDLGETQDAIAYYHQANKLLSNTSNLDQIGQTYLGLASSYRRTEELELASVYASYAVAMFETLKNLKLAIEVKRDFATVEQDGKTRSDALQKLEECLAECKRYNFIDLCASIHGDIAGVHLQHNEPLLSLQTAEEGLVMVEMGSVSAATLHRMKGMALGMLDKHREAVQALEEAIQLYESNKLKAEVADCYTLLAGLYQLAGDEQTANQCLIRMRQVMKECLKERGFVITA